MLYSAPMRLEEQWHQKLCQKLLNHWEGQHFWKQWWQLRIECRYFCHFRRPKWSRPWEPGGGRTIVEGNFTTSFVTDSGLPGSSDGFFGGTINFERWQRGWVSVLGVEETAIVRDWVNFWGIKWRIMLAEPKISRRRPASKRMGMIRRLVLGNLILGKLKWGSLGGWEV